MLILSRKVGESLLVDGTIEVKIIEVSGDKVKIGINAPKDVPVLRNELCQTVESNQEAASGISPAALRSKLSDLKKETPPA